MIAQEQLRIVIEKKKKLPDSIWEEFSSKWSSIAIKKGEFLTQNGEKENFLYFVKKGLLRGYILKNGQEKTLGFSYDNDFSGGYDSYLSDKPTITNIIAESNSTLLKIAKTTLESQCTQYHEIEHWCRKFNEQLLLGISMQQIYFQTMNAEERFERLMRDSEHLLQLVAQKHIASYLGMTPETFSRLRNSRIS